jgi:hypothetical protein
MAEPRAKLFESIEMFVVPFGAVNGSTGSVKSCVGIRTGSCGIDAFEIPVLEASSQKSSI